MFTGLIEEVGKILKILKKEKSLVIEILAKDLCKKIKIGDSVAVNGVCLTVVSYDDKKFSADVSPETFEKTNLKFLKSNDFVNLETSLTLTKPLGGHIVTGHVDDVGEIFSKKELIDFTEIGIKFPINLRKYIVEKGSIAINGISLTVNEIKENILYLMIIPHTMDMTNLKYCNIGDKVNIEVDIIGKYVENMLKFQDKEEKNALNIDFLKKHGFA